MRIFLFEYLTGGGLLIHGAADDGASLAAEGAAMVIALATDFASIRDLQVVVLRDVRVRLTMPSTVQVRNLSTRDDREAAFAVEAACGLDRGDCAEIDDSLCSCIKRVRASGRPASWPGTCRR